MAIPVTQAVKNAMKAPVKQLRAKIEYYESGDEEEDPITITSADDLISLKKEAEGYYLSSALRKITIVLAGTTTDLLNKRATATIEVKTGTNTWGQIPWGSFWIREMTVNEEAGTTTFIGYGEIHEMQSTEYSAGALNFPTTVAGLAEQIAARFGIEIETDLTTLPQEYQRVEYIASTGVQKIDTGYRANQDTVAEIDLRYSELGAQNQRTFGTRAGQNADKWGLGATTADKLWFRHGDDEPQTAITTDRMTIRIALNKLYINGEERLTAGTTDDFQTQANLFICDTGEGTAFKGETYRVRIWENGTLIKDFIPCYRKTDSKPGLYEVVGGAFYTNSGTDADFTVGANVRAIPNLDASITEDLWAKITGTTYRDILEQIAGATGTMAVISGGDNNINFIPVPISGTTEALTTANLKKLKIGNSWGVANAVVLSRLPQNDNIELIDQESIAETGQRTDVVIANNEILDPQRTTAIVPLLPAITGWAYRDGQITTEGHGWHEVGDTLSVTVAGETYQMIVTKSAITINGGISEILTSTTPEPTTINYAQAGGITKTIYNTEITVDKQGQEIIAIVSRQDATDATVASHYSEIKQDLQNITATVQTVGGGNLILNSVGYGVNSDGTLTNWAYGTGATTETVNSESSPSSLTAGATSGNQINITGATISQRVAVTPGVAHTISARIHQHTVGSGQIRVHNQLDDFSITIADQEEYIWKEKVLTFTPTQDYIDVELTSAANTTTAITDLMLAQGDSRQSWKQAAGEIYNTQVSIDAGGVQVRSSAYQGDYVQITPLEFAGYSNASGAVRKVFSLNRETTEVEKLKARAEIDMPPIKIVPINNSSYRGWAFVKES